MGRRPTSCTGRSSSWATSSCSKCPRSARPGRSGRAAGAVRRRGLRGRRVSRSSRSAHRLARRRRRGRAIDRPARRHRAAAGASWAFAASNAAFDRISPWAGCAAVRQADRENWASCSRQNADFDAGIVDGLRSGRLFQRAGPQGPDLRAAGACRAEGEARHAGVEHTASWEPLAGPASARARSSNSLCRDPHCRLAKNVRPDEIIFLPKCSCRSAVYADNMYMRSLYGLGRRPLEPRLPSR